MPTKPSTPPTSAGETRPLIILDGMSLAFRAYFALPDTLKTSAGVTTNAVHGFTSMVLNLVKDHDPVGLAVAFDLPGGTFRDDIVDDYKGGRDATPADLPPQFEMIRDVLESLAIPVIEAEGFEADDVLATLASEARDRGHPVIIVTGDRDSYQLVEDPYIRVLYNRRGVSDYALYDEAGIEERTGVLPHKYPLLAALRGDPSDNLPGVPGVGEKTAAKLINEYGDLDTLYAHLDALSPKLRQNLADHADRVRLNAEVIPLVRDVPLDVDVEGNVADQGDDLGVQPHPVGVVGQVLAQLWRQGVEVGVEGVEIAVLVDQLGRRLLSDSRNAWQIVRRVATQCGQQRVLVREDTGPGLDAGLVVERVVAHPSPVVEDPDVGVLHQLVGVAVAG